MKKNDIKQKLKGRKPGQFLFAFSRRHNYLLHLKFLAVSPSAKEDLKNVKKENHKDGSKGRKSG